MDSIEDYLAASSPVIDYQMGSLLYRLPQELRDQIYSHLFASTRLSRGTRQSTSTPPTPTPTPSPSPSPATTTATTTTTRVKPDPNALAILRTCRRACYEISDSWIRQVSFHFEQPAALLDTLTALPQTTRAQIRRVRVGARKLELGFPGSKFRACYGLASTLKLVPGLNLDVLTVLGSSGGDGDGLRHDYETLDGLVREGSGWRELRFISKSSALLGYANVVPSFLALDEDDGGGGGGAGARECRFWRKPQPAHWRGVMNERDGEVAEPSVMVYRARQRQQQQPWRGCCGVLDEKTRETYEQEVPQGRMAMEDFGIWGDKVLLADGEREKEMLIVVRRGGAGVEYEEKEGSPLITGDIRQEMGGIDWEAMRRDHIDALEEMRVVEDGIEFDEYDDVDEYVWPTICREPGTNIYAGV